MRTILYNKRTLVSRTIRQQNPTVRWQATKCNARKRISKHKAFNQVSGTLAAGTMRKLMITLQHSPIHEIQAIELRAMHIDNLEIYAFWCAFGARRTPMKWRLQFIPWRVCSTLLSWLTWHCLTTGGLPFPQMHFRASWNQVIGRFLVAKVNSSRSQITGRHSSFTAIGVSDNSIVGIRSDQLDFVH